MADWKARPAPEVKVGDFVSMTNNEYHWNGLGPRRFIVEVHEVHDNKAISGKILNYSSEGVHAVNVPWLYSWGWKMTQEDGWDEVLDVDDDGAYDLAEQANKEAGYIWAEKEDK